MMDETEDMFWADRIAGEVLSKKRFHYSDRPVKHSTFTVKTSASLSGVLHIGRLTDTVRGNAVYRALADKGVKAQFIWVAEDMDPLRKVPAGVPKSFVEHIGLPVSRVPDPSGCHDSYAQHFKEEYLGVMNKFVDEPPQTFSMTEEYDARNFKPYVKKIMENAEEVRRIVGKSKIKKCIEEDWFPWRPVCSECGKIITPRFLGLTDDGRVKYKCEDYAFKSLTAKGCGHEGEADPMKDAGKLAWKSEWAMQWARWGVVAEGAGKEYNIPTSAWFVNAEISERVLSFPMPTPIFYEYIVIGKGEKMSASVGNVVYPKDWLEVGPPEVLRYLFLKKITKTRGFNWEDVPKLFDDYHQCERVFFGEEIPENKKEEEHLKRLYELSQTSTDNYRVAAQYSLLATISQVAAGREVEVLQKLGHLPKDMDDAESIEQALAWARYWVEHYSPEDMRVEVEKTLPEVSLSEQQKKGLSMLAEIAGDPERISKETADIAKKAGLKPKELFQAAYLVLIGREQGPRLAQFIASLDEDFVRKRFKLEE
ncbi:MAG: lysine--tRNA ligase [Candidatus Diapherotrites archaeon]|nr:lysine--tRNA ligase [Candidatus Diapherotrites archaeon]